MNNLNINYYNLNTIEISKIINQNHEIINKINNTIINLPAFNIINNEVLLSQTIDTAENFIKNKKHFIVIGTGGSNLGSKALINILLKKEKNKIFFYDNIDPINFKNQLEEFELEKLGYIVISKSGLTAETLSQFGCLIEIFNQKKKIRNFF